MTILAVTGLAKEANIAWRFHGIPVIGAGDGARLEKRLEAAAARGAHGIISFGIAGALAPLLRPGDVIVASHVVLENERYATDARWSEAIVAKLPHARHAVIAGSPEIVSHVGAKRRLFRETGAHAVDMESHIAARVAKAHGIPFAALRTVADTCDQALPNAALVPLRPNGRIRLGAVLAAILGQPLQLGEVMATGACSRTAFRALFRSGRLLGPGLGCPYLG